MIEEIKNRKLGRPGPKPKYDMENESRSQWKPPEVIKEAEKGCKCGAPVSSLRVYGTAKDGAGNLLRRYVRCDACGNRMAIR
jgi:hypothetical protein